MSDQERFERMAQQVDVIHTVLLGVDGQGGLLRTVDTQGREITELKSFMSRLTGIAIGASALVSLAVSRVFGK